LQPYTLSFKTITAALAAALPGQTVYVYPGVYNETITIPTGVALRGTNALTTIIQSINPSFPTTVVRLNQNTRLEDIQINISLATAPNPGPYIAIDFLTGASITAKVRSCTINATLSSGNANIYGIRSSGSSVTTINPAHALRACQITVTSNGAFPAVGVLVNGPNWFEARDSVISALGTGSNLVACETNDPNATFSIKTTTINGLTNDLLRVQGHILIGATDLINHTAPNGFTVDIQPSTVFFGILGFPGGNLTYYLPPTVSPVASISTTIPYPFNFITDIIIFSISVNFSGTVSGSDTITFTIYKNNVATGLSIVIDSTSPNSVTYTAIGVKFQPTDYLDARLTTVGTPNVSTFTGKVLTY